MNQMGYYVSSAQYSTMVLWCYIDWHCYGIMMWFAGEFAQPLSGFQDGFEFPLYYIVCTTKLVVYSKGKRTNGHRDLRVWTSFGTCSARNIQKEREKRKKERKNWPVLLAMLSAHACFCIVSGESQKRNRERTEAAKEDRGCTRLLEAEIEETN